MTRTLLIEVKVTEVDTLDSSYSYNPRVVYELTPTDPSLDEAISFTCRRSELNARLARLDKTGTSSGSLNTHRAIYSEPEQEVGDLVRDAAQILLGGLGAPAIDVIADSIEEAVMPERVKARQKRGD